jgi:hypothetical protein
MIPDMNTPALIWLWLAEIINKRCAGGNKIELFSDTLSYRRLIFTGIIINQVCLFSYGTLNMAL